MIRDDDELNRTRSALINMESILLSYKQTILPANPARFALMAEPLVDHIRGLRREIEDYIGYTFAVTQQSEPAIARMLEGETQDVPPPPPNGPPTSAGTSPG